MSIALKALWMAVFFLLPFNVPAGAAWAADYKFLTAWNYIEKWQFQDVTGLFHDAAGNLYTIDENLCLVNKYNPAGDLLLRFGSCGAETGRFLYPGGIGVDSYGYIYIADSGNTRIQKFDSQGKFVQSWPMPKDSLGRSSIPYDIAVDAADSIYVAGWLTAKVYKFTPNGALQRIFGDNDGPGQIGSPQGVCVAPNGDVYVSEDNVGSILRFDQYGAFISRFGDDDTLDGYIGGGSPGGMSLMNNDSVLVALRNVLFRYAFDGTFIESLGEYGNEDHQFWGLNDVSVGPTGTVAVGSVNPMVQLFTRDPSWSFVAAWKSASDAPGFFNSPADFAFGPGGVVYVADAENNRIQKFDANGNFITAWGSGGAHVGQFNLPYSVDVDDQGNVYVSDFLNYRIQKFDANGNFIKAWGTMGSGYVEFQGVTRLRFAPDGNLYTLDRNNSRIQIFNKNGDYVSMWGTPGDGEGELIWPEALAIDDRGHVFISDYYNRIQKFTAEGVFIGQFGGGLLDPTFERIEDMTFDSRGNLVALRFDPYQQKILTVDPVSGSVLASFGETGIEPGRFFWAIIMRTSPAGKLFVGEVGANRVQIFQEDNKKFWILMTPAILSNPN